MLPPASTDDLDSPLYRFPTHVLSLVRKAETRVPATKKFRVAGLFGKAAALEREQLKRSSAQNAPVSTQIWCPQVAPQVPAQASKDQAASPADVEAWDSHLSLCEYRNWCEARGAAMDPAAVGYFARDLFPVRSCARGRPISYAVLSDQIRCAAAIYRAEIEGHDVDATASAVADTLGRRKSFALMARKQFTDEECDAQLRLAAT